MSGNLSLAGLLLFIVMVPTEVMHDSAACLKHYVKDKHAGPSSPFPIAVDKTKGNSGIYPNRVQDRDTLTWYVFVPGGKFAVGSDKHKDSKPIQVTVSEFYISEKQVSYRQIAQYIERQFQEAMKDVDSRIPKDATLAQAQDARKVAEVMAISIVSGWWPNELRLESDPDSFLQSLPTALEREKKWQDLRAHKTGFEKVQLTLEALRELKTRLAAQNRDMEAAQKLLAQEAALKVTLSAEQRDQASKIVAAFKGRVAVTSRGEAPYRTAHYLDARGFARSRGVSLPTEAQWEIAARLHEAKRLDLEGMFDEILEWCADYYAHDYYNRKDDFRDPQGPRRSRFSDEQLQKEFYDSGLGLGRRLVARDMRVLRGRDSTTRDYGRAGESDLLGLPYVDSFRRSKGIRLVYNPMQRRVDKSPREEERQR